jgi:cytochrome P450
MPNMFSTLGSREHSARKRMISNVYSKSYIQSSEPAIAQARVILFERLLPLLKESANGIDVHSLFQATTMDFISAYAFGIRNSTNFIQDKGYRGHWQKLYLARTRHHFWPQEMPGLTAFMKKLGIYLCPAWVYDANREIMEWNKQLCDRTGQVVFAEKLTIFEPIDEPVVFKALHAGIDREQSISGVESPLYPTSILHRDLSIASEILDHILAGQETAGITLTYAAWHLSQSLDLQHELRAELMSLEPKLAFRDGTPGTLPDPKQLDALPLLHAILMETLRLHAAIPGPQPRQTPYPSCQLGDYTVSGGVRVASLAYTLHLNEQAFPNPRAWDHRRWLPSETTQEERKERHRRFWAFGSGGRMCIGSNFAMHGEFLHLMAAKIWVE